MGLKIHKSGGAWQTYEQGTRFPGGEVFQELYDIGININWLLSGEGAMLRTEQKQDTQSQQATTYDPIDITDDEYTKELICMPPAEFWELFSLYGQISIAQAGWSQMEIIKRFPEFRRWLKKRRESEMKAEQLRRETA